mmetsp:Transcript_7334/g.16042  ORF Transcript_7334/g.16042 Transcript_7334/m.16042 type:complete len:517 (+) Transcript_7334:1-1551(+)
MMGSLLAWRLPSLTLLASWLMLACATTISLSRLDSCDDSLVSSANGSGACESSASPLLLRSLLGHVAGTGGAFHSNFTACRDHFEDCICAALKLGHIEDARILLRENQCSSASCPRVRKLAQERADAAVLFLARMNPRWPAHVKLVPAVRWAQNDAIVRINLRFSRFTGGAPLVLGIEQGKLQIHADQIFFAAEGREKPAYFETTLRLAHSLRRHCSQSDKRKSRLDARAAALAAASESQFALETEQELKLAIDAGSEAAGMGVAMRVRRDQAIQAAEHAAGLAATAADKARRSAEAVASVSAATELQVEAANEAADQAARFAAKAKGAVQEARDALAAGADGAAIATAATASTSAHRAAEAALRVAKLTSAALDAAQADPACSGQGRVEAAWAVRRGELVLEARKKTAQRWAALLDSSKTTRKAARSLSGPSDAPDRIIYDLELQDSLGQLLICSEECYHAKCETATPNDATLDDVDGADIFGSGASEETACFEACRLSCADTTCAKMSNTDFAT